MGSLSSARLGLAYGPAWRPANQRGHKGLASVVGAGSQYLRVVLPTALALLLCNMDRICLSVAIIPMSLEFGWQDSLKGIIQSAFLGGYMSTQLLGGTMADRYGGRLVMMGGIIWFSLASMVMPLLLSRPLAACGVTLPALLLARFFVGFGEGVALPSMNNLIATHIQPERRATALGAVFTGFHTGNIVGLLLSPIIISSLGWRALFYAFGFLGLPLLLLWHSLLPKQPAPAAQASPGERADSAAASASLRQLLSSAAVWGIIAVNFTNHWGYFIFLNWMPSYFNRVLGLETAAASVASLLPWVVMAMGSSAAGLIADALLARGVRKVAVRKGIQAVSLLGAGAALLSLTSTSLTAAGATTRLVLALGFQSLGQAGFVANMSDIAPANAGQVFGLCNTFGSFAGILGTACVGFIVQATGSYNPVFISTAAMYIFTTAIWLRLCTADRMF